MKIFVMLAALLVTMLIFLSCKKTDDTPAPTPPDVTGTPQIQKATGFFLAKRIRFGGNPTPLNLPDTLVEIKMINDSTLLFLGTEVLRRPQEIGDTTRYAFADKANYIHIGSQTGTYLTYYVSPDTIYGLKKGGPLGNAVQVQYFGKRQ